MQLSLDLDHRPIIFIRFNPDSSIDINNNKIQSCFKLSKGICVIQKCKQVEWNNRLNILNEHIKYWCDDNNKTNKMLEVVQLFYDQNL